MRNVQNSPKTGAARQIKGPESRGLAGVESILFWILIGSSMFTGLPGPNALGELQGEGAFYASALIISYFIFGIFTRKYSFKASAIALATVVAAAFFVSTALNIRTISSSMFGDRSGLDKSITSSAVVIFYVLSFIAFSGIAKVRGAHAVLQTASRAAMFFAIPMCAIMVFEAIAWEVIPVRTVLRSVRLIWNTNPAYSQFRLTAFGFEPSFQAISAAGFLLLIGWRVLDGKRETGSWPRFASFVFFSLLILESFGGARTFGVIAFACVAFTAIWIFVRNPPLGAVASISLIVITTASQIIIPAYQASSTDFYTSVSNITRSANIRAAYEMWLAKPIFGQGPGQYGFIYKDYVPSYAQYSWEAQRFISERVGSFLPPSYNLYTRLAAETGAFGLIVWLFGISYGIQRAFQARVTKYQTSTTTAMFVGLGIISMSLAGISLDSFRTIFLWLFLAIAFSFPTPPREFRRASPSLRSFRTSPEAAQSDHEEIP